MVILLQPKNTLSILSMKCYFWHLEAFFICIYKQYAHREHRQRHYVCWFYDFSISLLMLHKATSSTWSTPLVWLQALTKLVGLWCRVCLLVLLRSHKVLAFSRSSSFLNNLGWISFVVCILHLCFCLVLAEFLLVVLMAFFINISFHFLVTRRSFCQRQKIAVVQLHNSLIHQFNFRIRSF